MSMRISIATCCYDKDFKLIMNKDWLQKVFELFNNSFFERILIVNTGRTSEICSMAEALLNSAVVDRVCFTEDYIEQIRTAFSISDFKYTVSYRPLSVLRNNGIFEGLRYTKTFMFPQKGKLIRNGIFTKTYDCSGYLLGPLTAILNTRGDYVLYFTEDCAMRPSAEANTWIAEAISLMKMNPTYIAARPFDSDLDSEWIDKFNKIGDFREAFTFSDRMFLADVNRLKNEVDYNCKSQGNYPAYGGAGFEARIYNYMKKEGLRMLICEKAEYIHESSYYHVKKV